MANLEKQLTDSLETHKIKHISAEIEQFKKRRDEVKALLSAHYGSRAYNPFMSGSFAKHTAINVKYDFDIVIPFKRDSFDTLESMFNDVHDYLKDNLADVDEIRKQKVSIGITFKEKDGVTVKLDVVPGRELSQDDYPSTGNLSLYFNKATWGFQKGSWQKTNISAQVDKISGKSEERKVIRLLKIWKHYRGENYKSFLIELFTIKALDGYSGESTVWARLKSTMQYIADHVTDESFQLLDPGNSSNNVLKTLDSVQRSNFKSTLENMLKNLESGEWWSSYYFPINEDFKEVLEKEKGYGENAKTYPPSQKRFG